MLQLIVAPLRRLGINKSGTPLEQVGTPESVLGSIGSFITGATCAFLPVTLTLLAHMTTSTL